MWHLRQKKHLWLALGAAHGILELMAQPSPDTVFPKK